MEFIPHTIGDVAQLISAVSAAIAAASSLINRGKIREVTMKVDRAVIVAAETKKEAVAKVDEVKEAVKEVKEVAVAVNAEVVAKVHEAGVEAGKEMANSNGKH